MKIDELPQVESHNLNDIVIPEEYEGFVYQWINLDKLKQYETTGIPVKIYYLGSRGSEKEQVTIGDGSYWQSSTSEEFILPFQDSNSNWRYEILGIYPTYDNSLETEIRMLRDVDAKNNELYYNESNGIPKDKQMTNRLKTNPDFADELLERIQSTIDNRRTKIDHPKDYEYNEYDFPIVDVSLSNHEEMNGSTEDKDSRKKKKARIQVRDADLPANQKDIADNIDEMGGNLDKCNPIVVFHDIWYEGMWWDELRIDGSTTVLGILRSKQHIPSKKVPTIIIHKSVHGGKLSDAQIEEISGLLNPRDEITKTPFTPKHGRKYVVKRYFKDGRAVKDNLNQIYLKKHKLNSKQITRLLTKAKDDIDLAEEYQKIEDAGKTRVDGRSKQYQDRWDRENKEMEKLNPNMRVIYASSGEQKMTEILQTNIEQMVGTNLINGTGQTELLVRVWHIREKNETKWNAIWKEYHTKRAQTYSKGLQVEIGIRIGSDDCKDISVAFLNLPLAE